MATTPKYDNDYVTLGYLNDTLDTETKETEKKIGEIPKNYNSPPVPPYYVNSLLLLNGQIYKCIKSRLVGSFNISDWQVVVSTNEIDEALKTIFDVNKLEYVEQEDGIIETFYQNHDPSLEWETDIEKNNHVSDLWTIDTLTCYQYVKNATNPVTYGWKRRTVPSTLFDVFDGYKKIFLQEPTNYSKDDLWFGETTKVALESSEEFNPEHWEERDDFVESSIIQQEEYHVIYLLPKITEINRQSIAEIKKAIDEITLTVSQTYTTKTEVEKYVDGVKTDIAEEYITKEESTAQLAITAKSISGVVEENVERIDGEISEQNKKISQTLQTVDEINTKLNNVADITTSGETEYATLELNNINESEPIYMKIRPVNKNISYLYPNEFLYPSEDLFMTIRTLRFYNKTTQEIIDYELPDDLLYYDENNYDELIFDYETRTVIVNKKVAYNANGSTRLLDKTEAINYPFPTLSLKDGDYTISLLGYSTGYLLVRLMTQNIYTTQFATRAEMNSEISAKADEINLNVDKKLTGYSTTTEMNAAINLKADSINLEVANKVNKSEYNGANIMLLVNGDTSSATINADKVNITGVISAINNNTTTTINGNKITTGSINAQQLSSNSITTDKIQSGAITADKIKANSITANQVASDIITTSNFSAQNINADKITSGTINGNNVSVTNLSATNITSGKLSVDRLDSKVITTDNFSAQNINASKITTGSINASNGVTIGGFTIGNYSLYGSTTNGTMTIQRGSSASVDLPVNGGRLMLGSTASNGVALTTASTLVISDTYGHTTTGDSNASIGIRAITGNIRIATNNALQLVPSGNLYINGHYGLTGQSGFKDSNGNDLYLAFYKGILVGASRNAFSTSTYPWLA